MPFRSPSKYWLMAIIPVSVALAAIKVRSVDEKLLNYRSQQKDSVPSPGHTKKNPDQSMQQVRENSDFNKKAVIFSSKLFSHV